jgi:hypothetical protein
VWPQSSSVGLPEVGLTIGVGCSDDTPTLSAGSDTPILGISDLPPLEILIDAPPEGEWFLTLESSI